MQILIEPNPPTRFIDWKLIFQYRDLLWLWVKRDFVSKYRQTLLGPLWFVIQPLSTALVFVVIFSKGLNISTEGIPPALFYLTGLTVWNYISQCLSSTSMTLVANSGLFKKVFFPRIILPFAYCLSSLVSMGIQLGVLILFGFLFWMKGFVFHPSSIALILPALLLHLVVLSFGLGLWLAALSMRYRDFHYIWGLVSPLWLYATPVSYPLSAIPSDWRWVIELNPITALVEGFRMGLLGIGEFNIALWSYSLVTTVILSVTGIIFFQKVERDCIDSL